MNDAARGVRSLRAALLSAAADPRTASAEAGGQEPSGRSSGETATAPRRAAARRPRRAKEKRPREGGRFEAIASSSGTPVKQRLFPIPSFVGYRRAFSFSLTASVIAGAGPRGRGRRRVGHGRCPRLCRSLRSISAGELRVVLQELLRVLAALADPQVPVGEPGAGLLDELGLDAHVDELALARDALAVVDVELRLPEGRGDLVLDDLDLGSRADDRVAVLERGDPADVDPDRRVELQRPAARRRLGVAEQDADLLADLVDEDQAGARTWRRWPSACAGPGTSGGPAGPSAPRPSRPRSRPWAPAPRPSR